MGDRDARLLTARSRETLFPSAPYLASAARRPQLLPALPRPDGSALSAKYAAAAVSASTRAPARFSARPSAAGSSCPSTVTVQRKRSAPCTLVSRTAHRAPPSGLTISSALGL